jgi:hypothetical protein
MGSKNDEYSSKTVKELVQLCKEKGIAGYSKKNKPSLIELIVKNTKQDTGKFRKNTKDQFYTCEAVSKMCVERIISALPSTVDYLWVEPSAGNGSFLHNIPSSFKKIGLDIEPKGEDIEKQDYLTWTPPLEKDIIVFGNPPFGRQSTLAKSFITKSCEFAKVIAFILPKSFTKPSMYNAFDLKFHLVDSLELEKNAFLINDTKYDVPCVFQIWEKKDSDRAIEDKVRPEKFEYVKALSSYDIAFRRVGGLAGKCYRNDGTDFSIQSHYFIKFDDSVSSHISTIIEKINAHIFPSNTVGPRSLSKSEVNTVINGIIDSLAD